MQTVQNVALYEKSVRQNRRENELTVTYWYLNINQTLSGRILRTDL